MSKAVDQSDVLKFLLRSWRTAGELRSRFGIKDPVMYVSDLIANGYTIEKADKEVGQFTVTCYRWNGRKL